MKIIIQLFAFLLLLQTVAVLSVHANNVRITSDITLTNQNKNDHSVYVNFDISWDNSWRDTCNWDAVWVFVKYSNNNAWKQGFLSTDKTEYSVETNNGIVPAFSVGTTVVNSASRGIGVFLYRNAESAGSNNWKNVKLKWYYGQNGITDDQAASASIKVFAVEMVYVPRQTYYLGYSNIASGYNSFFTRYYANSSTYSSSITSHYFYMNSENALTVKGEYSGGVAGSLLSYDNCNNYTLGASFPKGYKACYCMKYEITQEQYAEFINTLQPAQQQNRISALSANVYMSNAGTTASPVYRNGVRCKTAPSTSAPGVWGCDLNHNGIYGEADDGQNLACNFISWDDALAYADWAGLRPMTELEFEKSSKGPELIQNQYAWGTTNYTSVQSISNPGADDETSGTIGANVAYGNYTDVQGPIRSGCFATNTSSRENAGASYYGIMELSGNLWEQVVPVINSYSLASGFDGSHGDGELYSNGNTDISGWLTNVISGIRGGAWNSSTPNELQSGDRSKANTATTTRSECNGFRCVRTAQ